MLNDKQLKKKGRIITRDGEDSANDKAFGPLGATKIHFYFCKNTETDYVTIISRARLWDTFKI